MRRRLMLLALLGLMIAKPVLAAGEAKAPPPVMFPTPVIAIVDMPRILQESLAAKSVQQQIEAQRGKFQTEIEGQEKTLREAEQDLTKSRETVTPDVYADHEQQLRQKFSAVERMVQSKRKALDQGFSDAKAIINKNLQDVVRGVAKSHGANLVIVRQQALWSDQQLDITDEVLGQLNKTLPSVPVKVQVEDDAGQK